MIFSISSFAGCANAVFDKKKKWYCERKYRASFSLMKGGEKMEQEKIKQCMLDFLKIFEKLLEILEDKLDMDIRGQYLYEDIASLKKRVERL